MATTAGILPLADLILHAQEESDRVGSQFHSPSELAFYANQSAREYYDILTQKYGDDYVLDPTSNILSFQTDGQSEFYPLPDDFYKLALCVVSPNGQLTSRQLVPAFTIGESTQLMIPNVPVVPYYGVATFRHKLAGNKIWFLPPPGAGQTVLLYWYPRMRDLVQAGTVSMAGCRPGDALTVNGRTFTAVQASPGQDEFQVGADGGAAQLQLLLAASAASLGLRSVGLPPGGTVLTLNIYDSEVAWSQSGGHIGLSPAAASWSDRLDGVNGWTEYVVVDMAIKMMAKEESDTSALERRKAALVARVQRMASVRDAGAPKHVTRTRNVGWGGLGFLPGGGY